MKLLLKIKGALKSQSFFYLKFISRKFDFLNRSDRLFYFKLQP